MLIDGFIKKGKMKESFRKYVAQFLVCMITMVSLFTIQPITVECYENNILDKLGCTHVDGKYNFTSDNYLLEGAKEIQKIGFSCIKLFLIPSYDSIYSFNSSWPTVSTLKDLADTQYFKTVFDMNFKTYVLETYTFALSSNRDFLDGMTQAEKDSVQEEMYQLTKYLLTTYAGTNKTFILQNWEGENQLREHSDISMSVKAQSMVDWLNARQVGVDKAIKEVGQNGVWVKHACETNSPLYFKNDPITFTEDVIPYTNCDLYSLSSWDTCYVGGRQKMLDSLNYLDSYAPGSDNIYVGEFGAAANLIDNPDNQKAITQELTEAALDWGALYVIYWELYCNDRRSGSGMPVNSDMAGFWLIPPDGSHTPTYNYFFDLFHSVKVSDDKTYSASSYYQNDPLCAPEKAFDGSTATKWCSDPGEPSWITVDLGSNKNIGRYVIKHAGSGGEVSTANTRDFKIQVSTDGLSWTEIDSVSGNTSNETDRVVSGNGRYIRLYITRATSIPDNTCARIYEFEVYSYNGSILSNEKTYSASSYYQNDPLCAPEKAFDGSTATKWCSDSGEPSWITVDLGLNKNITRFVIKHAGSGGEVSTANTRDFKIQVSNDSINWTNLYDLSGNTLNITSKDVAGNGRYVRLYITRASSISGDAYARIYEFQVYGN
ncbi:MAG: discoidin domain-containing protein [Firmicutes bacterium]|nr:discoidin domain-containing protein [Bacillota bacterium]